ncbi:uncharacterized protein Z519_11629 [Cladophialophora bantiana CBS 173.52]|uniref:G domain-containing protein n=1 Tax=Cladophialophora bantiana (strain ATCC 10958 / CBS 173.52 / CDC B-1940 / NIH 8579) TaxID=1442370 RepID=A0A0D2H9U2_CLAB1|nr:uncharacterized protein Z519_11629 [Cladophialophora bantiana CBS 173.52]KIW87655.1 hypothetical protein Z519_11629 [Cladophialophora bantiana CBS 173.52]
MLSEARKHGLYLQFSDRDVPGIEDPRQLVFPDGTGTQTLRCINGISVDFWDITSVMCREGRRKELAPSKIATFGSADRVLFAEGKLAGQIRNAPVGAFIHPSVFFMDGCSYSIIRTINESSIAAAIQKEISFMDNTSQRYLDITEHSELISRPLEARVLVCGPTKAGKGTLINQVLGREANVVHENTPGPADIETARTAEGPPYKFHDSRGFDRSERHEEYFWQARTDNAIQPADLAIMNLGGLGGVPVILVFTKLDSLISTVEEATHQAWRRDQQNPVFRQERRIERLPTDAQDEISRQARDVAEAQDRLIQAWRSHPGMRDR